MARAKRAPLFVQGLHAPLPGPVEFVLELQIDATTAVDDLARPCEIVALAPDAPFLRRAEEDGVEVARLVGELDHLGAARFLRCLLDLQALAFGARQRLVV